MNPLKTLFNKVFDATPPAEVRADASKEDDGFEWNPEQETVAPTVANASSWKRGGVQDDGPIRSVPDPSIAESAPSLPAPAFEAHEPASRPEQTTASAAPPAWNESARRGSLADIQAVASVAAAEPVVRPTASFLTPAPAAVSLAAQPALPLSDFEEVYRKASIKSPVHGYGVERVYRLLTSRRLAGLDRSVRRSALLTALDAAGVPVSDVAQDAVLRRKALAAYEAEKALELQSLRSRNESRNEALQDTIETFTRQKQAQIERLAQGSTSAVRTQSDLEIRKRMEQDRLYRSLSYFLEPLPSPAAFPGAISEPKRTLAEVTAPAVAPSPMDEAIDVTATAELSRPFVPRLDVGVGSEPVPSTTDETLTEAPPADYGAATVPLSTSGLEMALRAAAEEARTAGWGRTAIVEDTSADAADALRKLREAQKTDGEP